MPVFSFVCDPKRLDDKLSSSSSLFLIVIMELLLLPMPYGIVCCYARIEKSCEMNILGL